MPRSTIDPVGSNARCGSDVFNVNELSTTSVEDALRCAVAASAAAVQASATRATRGTASCRLRKRERLKSNSFCLLGGFQTIGRRAPVLDGEAATAALRVTATSRQRTDRRSTA